MTNIELQSLLKELPDDLDIWIDICNGSFGIKSNTFHLEKENCYPAITIKASAYMMQTYQLLKS